MMFCYLTGMSILDGRQFIEGTQVIVPSAKIHNLYSGAFTSIQTNYLF